MQKKPHYSEALGLWLSITGNSEHRGPPTVTQFLFILLPCKVGDHLVLGLNRADKFTDLFEDNVGNDYWFLFFWVLHSHRNWSNINGCTLALVLRRQQNEKGHHPCVFDRDTPKSRQSMDR